MFKVLATGTIMADILAVELERIADPGEVIYLEREVEVRIGGHPIDVAIDLVKLGLNPQEIGLVAAVGKGLFGDYVKRIIEQYRIPAFLQEIDHTDTGKNIILENKGEDRRFHIDPGANWYLDPEFVRGKIRELSPEITCLRPGYSGLDLKLEEIFREAKACNSFLFLDMMEFHPTRPAGLLLPLFHYADAVHCNQREAMINTAKDNPEEAVKEILRRGAKAVFLTKGGAGAELITQELRIVQPGFAVDTVDATGAGDAFCAGVVYQLLGLDGFGDINGLSRDKLVEVLMMGQAAGASAATQAGCVEGVDKDKVNQLISQQKEAILNGTVASRYSVG